jgi:hypothetical protein
MMEKSLNNKVFLIMYVLILIFTSSCLYFEQWWDDQISGLECYPDEWGKIYCEDRSFYICHTSCTWERLIKCEEIEDYVLYCFDDSDFCLTVEHAVSCCRGFSVFGDILLNE